MSPRGMQKNRSVTISKALSYLLRHGAEKEGLKMNAQGYANVADVLSWRKLKSLKVTLPEILDAVAESDKKRFALLHIPSQEARTSYRAGSEQSIPTSIAIVTPTPAVDGPASSTAAICSSVAPATVQETATQRALLARDDSQPSNFLIRATQGHSIKNIEASSYLERLSLADETTLPKTVVHGTFRSAWLQIVESGGLKCMGRNHVHFATGPALEAISEKAEGEDEDKVQAATGLCDGKVTSGMRKDAQVLIYIDLKRALAAGCPFWRSENGVILSEGLTGSMVPCEFFDVAVERSKGLGLGLRRVWEGGKAVR